MPDHQQTSANNGDNKSRFFKLVFKKMEEDGKIPWPEESRLTFLLWIISILIDPLLFYIPVINHEKKSVLYHKAQLIILSILYIMTCILINMIYILKFTKQGSTSFWRCFRVSIPLFVPIYAVGVMFTLAFWTSNKLAPSTLLSIVIPILLLFYLGRVFLVYGQFIFSARKGTAIFKIWINILLFFYGGHLFGGLWYFFAVFENVHCWKKACISNRACLYENNGFFVSSGGYTFFDEMCSDTTEDNSFDFGIFTDAIKSHIVETPHLGRKLLYCFRWGIQNISGYGQNLEVGTNALENILVILMAFYGIVTFTFFIGNLQNLMKTQSSVSNQKRISRWTRTGLSYWSPFKRLSEENQDLIVKSCRQSNWPQSGAINLQNLFTNLPGDVQMDIKRVFCTELLKQIQTFKEWSNEGINQLCDYAKPVIYEGGYIIVEVNKPVDELLLVVEGMLEFKSNPRGFCRRSVSYGKQGSIFGEELVIKFEKDPNSTQLPTSSKTIKIIQEVHAFAIVAEDIQNAMKEYKPSVSSQATNPGQ